MYMYLYGTVYVHVHTCSKMAVGQFVSCVFLVLFASSVEAFPSMPKGDPLISVQGLISRILGQNYVDKFTYEVIDDQDGWDIFEVDIDTINNKPVLRGNNGVALASAFNYYLKYYCNCSISWGRNGSGDQLRMPSVLPLPEYPDTKGFPNKYRYYFNVVTFSYSMVWWDWARWEREIDWMAMNGLNFILSFTGQEYVWQKFYTSIGLTDDEIKDFFSGPAFLAWQRMGNIQGWAGPLDDGWIQKQADLQKQIVKRIREFGMINILPGFAGHIPSALTRVYPNASVTHSAEWNRFGSNYSKDAFLQPDDPLFVKLGQKYYETLIGEYGTDHYYNADSFNEMDPSSNDDNFLATTNEKIYEAMASVDSQAVYLMQGWLFRFSGSFWTQPRIQAFLSKVPNDSMIILDLSSDEFPVWSKTNSYYGKPFLWCMVHNYGGVRAIYGDLATIASDPVDARNTPGNTMVGVGMTPEGIETNPVMYELMAEMGWRWDKVDVLPWLDNYATRRYGNWTPAVHEAWQLLLSGAYSNNWGGYTHSFVVLRPRTNLGPDTRFKPGDILQAWKVLSTSVLKKELDGTIGPLRYDLVDFGRQILVNLFADVYTLHRTALSQYSQTFLPARVAELKLLSATMLDIIDDLDALLASNSNFLFGNWLAEARQSAAANTSEDVLSLIEFNARNQITLWGPIANIEDYAAKEWAGLISSYYKQRWQIYTTWVDNATSKGLPLNTTFLEEPLTKFEDGWNDQVASFPTTPTGDSLDITSKYLQKYTLDQDYVNSKYTLMYNLEFVPEGLLYGQPVTLWTDSFEQFVWLCEMNSDCAGFSYPPGPVSFKSAASMNQSGNNTSPFQFKSGSILFMKKSQAKKYEWL